MAYNTGNPLGSIDARDLYDNAQNMDKAVNQTTARWSDRFGVSRPSWAGMSHYNNVGEYAAGILITGYNEVFRYEGEFYRAAAATVLPYTTTGSWSEDGPFFVPVGDAVLRHDIAYEADTYIGYYRNAINCNQYGGLEAAVADADTLGKTIIVTDTQDVSIPLDFTGRNLSVEYGGLITFSGTGAVTGLKEARPEWFGMNTTPGTTDMTSAIVKAIASAPVIIFQATSYYTDSFSAPANKNIVTAGLATTFVRSAAAVDGVRTITVTGSNVTIGSHSHIGNIATETGEQNHCVFIQATDATGDISNVHIGDVTGTDIRGDVVYAGQGTGAASKLRNVSIGNVVVNNVYRNGVSLVSGDGITVASVTGSQIGLVHLDIESNVGSGPTTNVTVGYIKGRSVGLIGQAPADYVDNVTIDVLDLSTDHASQSTPSYAPGVTFSQDALVVRNLISANIGTFRVDGYDRYAIGGVDTSGLINIGTVYARNCAVASTTYDAYFKGVYRLNIGYLDIAITGTNKRGFDGFSFINISNIKADIQSSAVLLRNCTDVTIGNIVQSGAGGFMLTACSRIIINGGSFSGTRLATTSHQCTFKNFVAATVTAGFMFSSTHEDHILINTTLTTDSDTAPVVDYYAMGTGIVDHVNTLRFGAYHLWIGTGGKLYIKDSAPANITDGTIVGTQS